MYLNNQFWVLRQNYYNKNTDQLKMKSFIKKQQFIACPYGDYGEHRENIINGIYNNGSRGQDRKFVEEMKIGDIVLIPLKENGFILARITSSVIYSIETGSYTRDNGDKTIIDEQEGGIPFRPVGRKIEIIREISEIPYRLSYQSLTKMSDSVKNFINHM